MCQAASQLPRENLMQRRFFQIIQRDELALGRGIRGVSCGTRLFEIHARVLAVEDAPYRLAPLQHRRLRLAGNGSASFTCCGVGSRSCDRAFRLLTGSLAMGNFWNWGLRAQYSLVLAETVTPIVTAHPDEARHIPRPARGGAHGEQHRRRAELRSMALGDSPDVDIFSPPPDASGPHS